ncbi:hypothetical protein NQ317_018448 [Molorchus minor]|uniref:Uncharacterized protein n=1 Tax=Molorchus minor TaxID=1323400 RepID=A0ABQ9JEB9_9CUCU|nr:hypothetical protein NQ317_018448 [Molorchus minor]
MWIELSKVVVYFFFCSNVVSAYYAKQDYSKQSDRDSSNKYYSSVSGSRFNNDNYKLRQSRFPKIDKVKTRIEQMNSELSSSSYVKIRHKGWSNYRPLIRTTTTPTTTTTEDEGLFESYGDSDEDLDYLFLKLVRNLLQRPYMGLHCLVTN